MGGKTILTTIIAIFALATKKICALNQAIASKGGSIFSGKAQEKIESFDPVQSIRRHTSQYFAT